MNGLMTWLENRTGIRALLHEALYERIPGGSRWCYVWGSTLVFAFFTQVITGLFLWMAYSPGSTSAWESVYYIQHEMSGGWFLRGLHHFMAQAMVVLLVLHLMQVVIDGAYRAPREVNFWLGLILMMITLGLALTGYLLPWDQKGYWATIVATNLLGLGPGVGEEAQVLAVGGGNYGQLTLTRFFALHAGVLPVLLVGFLVLHVAIFRKHGIHAVKPDPAADTTFWPDQVLKDAIACLAVLLTVIFLIFWPAISGRTEWSDTAHLGAEMGAPADSSSNDFPPRPEWYFLFLFQFLKLFEGQGEFGEQLGAIFIPGLLMLVLFLMPIVGRWKLGHRFNVLFLFCVLGGAAWLTYASIHEDTLARGEDSTKFAELEKQIKIKSYDKNHHFVDAATEQNYAANKAKFDAYIKSRNYLSGVEEAEREAKRAVQLASGPRKIPVTGALSLLRDDPMTQGPKLFKQNCLSCHDYYQPPQLGNAPPPVKKLSEEWLATASRMLMPAFETVEQKDEKGNPIKAAVVKRNMEGEVIFPPSGAPNLYGFASRAWIAGLLDKAKISHLRIDKLLEPANPAVVNNALAFLREAHDAIYFGNTKHKDGEMAGYVQNDMTLDMQQLEQVAAALSAEAKLPAQQKLEAQPKQQELIAAGQKLLNSSDHCASCHHFRGKVDWSMKEDTYPDLEGYGSREWLLEFIANPGHARFYNTNNDRMPAFAGDPKTGTPGKLSRRELELLADWLRGDDPNAAK